MHDSDDEVKTDSDDEVKTNSDDEVKTDSDDEVKSDSDDDYSDNDHSDNDYSDNDLQVARRYSPSPPKLQRRVVSYERTTTEKWNYTEEYSD